MLGSFSTFFWKWDGLKCIQYSRCRYNVLLWYTSLFLIYTHKLIFNFWFLISAPKTLLSKKVVFPHLWKQQQTLGVTVYCFMLLKSSNRTISSLEEGLKVQEQLLFENTFIRLFPQLGNMSPISCTGNTQALKLPSVKREAFPPAPSGDLTSKYTHLFGRRKDKAARHLAAAPKDTRLRQSKCKHINRA